MKRQQRKFLLIGDFIVAISLTIIALIFISSYIYRTETSYYIYCSENKSDIRSMLLFLILRAFCIPVIIIFLIRRKCSFCEQNQINFKSIYLISIASTTITPIAYSLIIFFNRYYPDNFSGLSFSVFNISYNIFKIIYFIFVPLCAIFLIISIYAHIIIRANRKRDSKDYLIVFCIIINVTNLIELIFYDPIITIISIILS